MRPTLTIPCVRCGKPIVSFKQEDVSKKFFSLAKELGFRVVVTGTCVYTHELHGTQKDFETLKALSEE